MVSIHSFQPRRVVAMQMKNEVPSHSHSGRVGLAALLCKGCRSRRRHGSLYRSHVEDDRR